MPKLEAHQKGLLHRAFQVFIFNSKYELLLQKELLQNTIPVGYGQILVVAILVKVKNIRCCKRRLIEEMGIETSLEKSMILFTKAELDNDLTEHEFDHVLYGIYNEDPIINKDEADDFKWIDMDSLNEDIKTNGDNYTIWFKIAFEYFYNYLKK